MRVRSPNISPYYNRSLSPICDTEILLSDLIHSSRRIYWFNFFATVFVFESQERWWTLHLYQH
jgi:hypothetical protein